MKIGRHIYFDIQTGNVLVDTGEMQGFVRELPIEQEIELYQMLSERTRNSFDVKILEYGQYAEDFEACNGYRVNPETIQLEFSYPNPNEEEPQEPVYRTPLSEQVQSLEDSTSLYLLDLDYRLSLVELGM